jgi:beta-1,4-mannosyl-glycoprotein beta-1,4-N-acetylglucosaminyltransferase
MSFGMRRLRPWVAIPDGGWHFTSLNGTESVLDKLDSIAEFRRETGDAAAIAEQIKRRLEEASQPGERSRAELVEVDSNFPSYLVANQSRFANLIADRHAFERYGVQPPRRLVTSD